MSFNQKILTASFFILIIGLVGFLQYKKTHPPYVPPPIEPRVEKTITIIPGWNMEKIEEYLIESGFASAPFIEIHSVPAAEEITHEWSLPGDLLAGLDGKPYKVLESKPWQVSYEGYFAPETFRVYEDASPKEILLKLIDQREKEITDQMYVDTENFWQRVYNKNDSMTFHQILTMASIIERETKFEEDRVMVSDILWRRLSRNWALQVDSSVHYAVNKSGDLFTTAQERAIDSPWNTYKYPGLPPGPICNPSLDSIKAALYPQKNDYWFFLTDTDGKAHYGRTLEEHTANKYKYL